MSESSASSLSFEQFKSSIARVSRREPKAIVKNRFFVGVRELVSGISILILELIAVGRILFADSWKHRFVSFTLLLAPFGNAKLSSLLNFWKIISSLFIVLP